MKLSLPLGGLSIFLVWGGLACGGGGQGEPELEAYFVQLEAMFDKYYERGLDMEGPADFGGAEWSDVRTFFSDFASANSDFLAELNDMAVPAEASDLHTEYAAALDEVVAVMDQVARIENEADAEDFFLEKEDGYGAAALRGAAACQELELLATEQQINIDLKCGSLDEPPDAE